ncbi:hypothetical protein [Planomicrobium okeanokoites]|nr:hypothetical protein [Planomicrobium okeanokoites]
MNKEWCFNDVFSRKPFFLEYFVSIWPETAETAVLVVAMRFSM